MVKSLSLRNFTVFSEAHLKFGQNLNVITGENGTGKSHLLKLVYSALACSHEEGRRPGAGDPTKALLQTRLAEKLVGTFRPEALGRLARRHRGRERCDIGLEFDDQALGFAISFATQSRSEVTVESLPRSWIGAAGSPVFLPTRELMTIFPGFVSVYEGHYLELEETWRDTCLLLGAPIKRGSKEKRVSELLEPIEKAMGGKVELDANGRFYLRNADGRMEMTLVAEGHRKLAMLARLVATGALVDGGYLFWDEPEANLNPKILKRVAATIVDLSRLGLQVFVATHSLFLVRELEMAQADLALSTACFGLRLGSDGVEIEQGSTFDDVTTLTLLDEELHQSDRFLETMQSHG
jgi:energy-coupling factor transporter ATP-binding protein EcfA2